MGNHFFLYFFCQRSYENLLKQRCFLVAAALRFKEKCARSIGKVLNRTPFKRECNQLSRTRFPIGSFAPIRTRCEGAICLLFSKGFSRTPIGTRCNRAIISHLGLCCMILHRQVPHVIMIWPWTSSYSFSKRPIMNMAHSGSHRPR